MACAGTDSCTAETLSVKMKFATLMLLDTSRPFIDRENRAVRVGAASRCGTLQRRVRGSRRVWRGGAGRVADMQLSWLGVAARAG